MGCPDANTFKVEEIKPGARTLCILNEAIKHLSLAILTGMRIPYKTHTETQTFIPQSHTATPLQSTSSYHP